MNSSLTSSQVQRPGETRGDLTVLSMLLCLSVIVLECVCVCTFSSEGTSRPLHFGAFSSLKKSYCSWAACMAAAAAGCAGSERRSGTDTHGFTGLHERCAGLSGSSRAGEAESGDGPFLRSSCRHCDHCRPLHGELAAARCSAANC